MKGFIKSIFLLSIGGFAALFFVDAEYKDTRQQLLMNSRLLGANFEQWQEQGADLISQWPDEATGDFSVSRLRKNIYIRHAVVSAEKQTPADVALKMNQLEWAYHVPYSWGGSVHTGHSGFDCSGFLHGIYYYLGLKKYRGRFTTKSLYKRLEKDKTYIKLFDASYQSMSQLNRNQLNKGDIILWPSGFDKHRNIKPSVIGHVGIISDIGNKGILVTHYGNSAKFNPIDKASDIIGSGINTIDFDKFVSYKKTGRLLIYQQRI